MAEIKELLAVSDLPEEEQWEWFYQKPLRQRLITGNEEYRGRGNPEYRHKVLADLAFRLRDEAKAKYRDAWYMACKTTAIWLITAGETFYNDLILPNTVEANRYEADILMEEPIVWILTSQIAALIAKKLSRKESKDG